MFEAKVTKAIGAAMALSASAVASSPASAQTADTNRTPDTNGALSMPSLQTEFPREASVVTSGEIGMVGKHPNLRPFELLTGSHHSGDRLEPYHPSETARASLALIKDKVSAVARLDDTQIRAHDAHIDHQPHPHALSSYYIHPGYTSVEIWGSGSLEAYRIIVTQQQGIATAHGFRGASDFEVDNLAIHIAGPDGRLEQIYRGELGPKAVALHYSERGLGIEEILPQIVTALDGVFDTPSN